VNLPDLRVGEPWVWPDGYPVRVSQQCDDPAEHVPHEHPVRDLWYPDGRERLADCPGVRLGWYCLGCGTEKPSARPGSPCPAGCGSLATTSDPARTVRGVPDGEVDRSKLAADEVDPRKRLAPRRTTALQRRLAQLVGTRYARGERTDREDRP